jgi:hypothetical protein
MLNIVKRRDFMRGHSAQTRQETEKLLAEKYGLDHIVVEANEPPSNPFIRQSAIGASNGLARSLEPFNDSYRGLLLSRRHVASCCEDVVRNVSNKTLVTFPD